MRRAKIVCTLGPSAGTLEQLTALVEAGMNVARLNLSHGSYEDHEERYRNVRQVATTSGQAIGILVDLQGPKIRLGTFANGKEVLANGARFTITTREVAGDATICGTTYKGLPGDCKPGDKILVDDGKLALEVESVSDTDVVTRVLEGGPISNSKGINLPGVAVSVPALSEKDELDLRWALGKPEPGHGNPGVRADMIALSFVRDAADIERVHEIMDEVGHRVPVIAKIEKPQAVANLDAIVDAFDAIMVARGDLGVELPLEQVPMVQKRCITLSRRNAKPVIVATQMLDSMITNSRPTRAEVSDVANAVLDGTDAVMLSAETSVGAYAVQTVETMAKIIIAAEEETLAAGLKPALSKPRTKGGAVARAAAELGENLYAKYLIAFTESGDTARRLSRYRPPTPLIAFTPHNEIRNQLALSWGIRTFCSPEVEHTDDMVRQVDTELLQLELSKTGDTVVIIAGSPPGIPGSTNAVRVHRVGDAISGVAPAYREER